CPWAAACWWRSTPASATPSRASSPPTPAAGSTRTSVARSASWKRGDRRDDRRPPWRPARAGPAGRAPARGRRRGVSHGHRVRAGRAGFGRAGGAAGLRHQGPPALTAAGPDGPRAVDGPRTGRGGGARARLHGEVVARPPDPGAARADPPSPAAGPRRAEHRRSADPGPSGRPGSPVGGRGPAGDDQRQPERSAGGDDRGRGGQAWRPGCGDGRRPGTGWGAEHAPRPERSRAAGPPGRADPGRRARASLTRNSAHPPENGSMWCPPNAHSPEYEPIDGGNLAPTLAP